MVGGGVIVYSICNYEYTLSENAVMEGPERLDRADRRNTDHDTVRTPSDARAVGINSGSNFTRVGGRQYCASDVPLCASLGCWPWPGHRNFDGRTLPFKWWWNSPEQAQFVPFLLSGRISLALIE